MPKPKKFEVKDNKEYKVKIMINSVMYSQQINNQMPGLYHLIL